jgi:hypothetical protein
VTTEIVKHFPIEMITLKEPLDAPALAAMGEYLKTFALFDETPTKCRCGRQLGYPGTIANVMGLDTMQWGIANGEGFCYACEWPARAIHRFDVDGKEYRFDAGLPYHPDFVTTREANDA